MNEDELTYFHQWISKAEEDSLVVRQLMSADIPVKGAIAYHCQHRNNKFYMGQRDAIVLFDGICHLCTGSVLFIIKRDPQGYFKFAALQTEMGKMILQKYNIDPNQSDSIILIEKNRVYYRSDAALRIVKRLRRGWPVLYFFIIIPPFIRDFFYSLVAKYRYRWFGKRSDCFVPDQTIRKRFITQIIQPD